ncbi:hypothetical protein [Paraliomyxa miuraensis]|uniref:hypothetical protein n=1 Tax=Paraliomyxa miuraensis TaxID=376150 RepID=UPI00224E871F|nr:hypothetical protein [Paraliomyxa miuraensis]MCX4240896.1 hypothetical protein [Paraliomyxa miuraensis]
MSSDHGVGEIRVLTGVKWIFFALGSVALVLFLLDPDIGAHPQLVLLAGTGLLGTLTLHGLSGILGPTSRD